MILDAKIVELRQRIMVLKSDHDLASGFITRISVEQSDVLQRKFPGFEKSTQVIIKSTAVDALNGILKTIESALSKTDQEIQTCQDELTSCLAQRGLRN